METHLVRELTVRRKEGLLLASLATEMRRRGLPATSEYNDALARCGQGYSLSARGWHRWRIC